MQMQNSMGLARSAGTNRILLATRPVKADEIPELVDVSNARLAGAAKSWTLARGARRPWREVT